MIFLFLKQKLLCISQL